jgi:hypothetical protein
MPTFNITFDVDLGYNNIGDAISLSPSDTIEVRFTVKNSSTSNYTASISPGNLKISSLATTTGYSSTACPYFNTSSISSSYALSSGSTNTIYLSPGLTNFHNNNYLFVPNPLTGSINSLYSGSVNYGDVDYPFSIKPFDIISTYLSDGTYIESRVIQVSKPGNSLEIKLDKVLSNLYVNNLISGSYKRFLVLTRVEDETSAYLTFRKRDGKTSYGFTIPQNIATNFLDNIDIITREVKQKLLADQQGTTS